MRTILSPEAVQLHSSTVHPKAVVLLADPNWFLGSSPKCPEVSHPYLPAVGRSECYQVEGLCIYMLQFSRSSGTEMALWRLGTSAQSGAESWGLLALDYSEQGQMMHVTVFSWSRRPTYSTSTSHSTFNCTLTHSSCCASVQWFIKNVSYSGGFIFVLFLN